MKSACWFPTVLLLISLAGCSGMSGDEGQAKSALKDKLDRWVAGNKDDSLEWP